MESTANEVREAIRQLPINERAVAIALKHIFDQVKDLTKKQQQQIDANHLSFITKFKQLQKKASEIIQGNHVLDGKDLDTSAPFFTPDEEEEKKKLLKQKNRMEQFWYKAIKNSEYGPDLTSQQEAILKAVVDLQTNITTNEIELILIVEKNDFITQGTFHRKLVLDNGAAISFEGDEPQWISSEKKVDGVLASYILANSKEESQLSIAYAIVANIVNEIVPYSLEYYLGAIDQEDDQADEEDEEEGEEEAEDQ